MKNIKSIKEFKNDTVINIKNNYNETFKIKVINVFKTRNHETKKLISLARVKVWSNTEMGHELHKQNLINLKAFCNTSDIVKFDIQHN